MIPGDGIGPEVVDATKYVLESTGIEFDWDVQAAGEEALQKYGTPLPDALLNSIRSNVRGSERADNDGFGDRISQCECRHPAGVGPLCQFASHPNHDRGGGRYDDVDLVVVRENTQGLYAGIEHDVIPGEAAEAIRIITRKASERIVRFAFDYAQRYGRRKVTAVHKSNILKITDGLFLSVAKEVADDYPDIEFEDRIVDNMAMQLVRNPNQFDVIVTTNLFGDILSDLCSGLVGGLGMAPGANIGEKLAVFEPVHGSAPKYVGQNKVNPVATILTGALMLRHLGEMDAARRIEDAVQAVVASGTDVTYDLKPDRNDPGAVGTRQMAEAIVRQMKQ